MQSNMTQMLQMLDRPAFCALDGIITCANQAALDRMICIGEPVVPLLSTGKAEYEAFQGNWLYLTIAPSGIPCGASVRRIDDFHLFTMEPDNIPAAYQVLALAAQELRNPLARVLTMTERLFPSLDLPDGSTASEQVARINRGLSQMLRIINNMSDAGRYTTAVPMLETLDVNAVLSELFDQAATLCEFAGVKLQFNGLPSPAHSLVDSDQLERCIYNLLSNALKHTPSGGSINASLTRKGNTLYLTVSDTGTGIDPEKTGNIFTQFLREPSLTDPVQGLGLGMTLIHAFAKAHGGTVLVASSPEKGFRLTLSLPIRLDTALLSSPRMRIDYAGERNHGLIELSDTLPHKLYQTNK